MSLRRRLLNVARAELGDAARRVKQTADLLLDTTPGEPEAPPRVEEATPERVMRVDPEPDFPPEIRRFYANLEIPVGSDAAEVKAAYRRLMRRYHPDKHATDPARAQLATELSQNIREAYEGLVTYLSNR